MLWVPATAAAQPIVRLIATGGTIANHSAGRLSATALAASVPDLGSIARVETETFTSVSSLELSLAEWAALASRASQVLAGGDVSGVVITSGSDTLEELAWYLDLTVASDRPVVVTGAMRRPSDQEPDGPGNLADALRVAGSRDARGRGTLVVMGGLILRARDATKVATSGVEAFGTFSGGPEGRVRQGRVRFGRGAAPRTSRRFAPGPLPRVDLLLTYQQAPGDLIDAAVQRGARGLVIAAAGAGAMAPGADRRRRRCGAGGHCRGGVFPRSTRPPAANRRAGRHDRRRRAVAGESAHPADAGAGARRHPRGDRRALRGALIDVSAVEVQLQPLAFQIQALA